MCIRLCVYTHVCGPAHVKFCIWLLGNEQDQVCLGKNSRKPWKPSLICPYGERGLEPWGGLCKQVGGSTGTPLVSSLSLLFMFIRIGSGVRGGTGGGSLWFLQQPLSEKHVTHTPWGSESGSWMVPALMGRSSRSL